MDQLDFDGAEKSLRTIALGWLEFVEGRYVSAASYFSRAADKFSKLMDIDHPRHAESLTYLARAQARLGQAKEGRATVRKALDICWQRLEKMLIQNWTQRDRLALVQELRTHPECPAWPGTLDTFIEIARSLNVPVEEQYREVLRWKGILDRFGQDGRTKIEVSSEVQVLRGQLGGLTADLRTAFFEQVSFSKRESRRRKINDLESQIEAVQRKLDGQIPLRPEPPTTPAEVARSLRVGTASLDILQIRFPANSTTGQQASVEPQYVGFLVRLGSDPVRIDLGSQKELDDHIGRWRASIEAFEDDRTLQDAVSELVWKPIQTHLKSIDTLQVCGDGVFHSLPWYAISTGEGTKTLIDNLTVIHCRSPLSSARTEDKALEPSLLAIGDVSYGPLSEKWKPLDATATEADAVSSAFHAKFEKGEVRLLKQLDAHEEEINRLLPGSRYVHLATHGFFVPQPGTDQFGVQTWIAQLQSGLIVAPPPSPGQASDQYLTAEEIGRLDLRGTELVVLSACESGRGSIQSGQGMVGLQQSFISAGAKGVISSLWKVDDLATAELMRLFYYYLWRENTNPSEALRRAQQALRANSQFAPSGYWAAFTFTQP